MAAFEDTFARRARRDSPPRMLEVPSSSRMPLRSRSGSRQLDPLSDPDYFNRSSGSSSGASPLRSSGSSSSSSRSRAVSQEFDDLPGPDFFFRR